MPVGFLITVSAVVLLVALYRRDRKKCRTQRAGFFAPALDLFQSYRVVQESIAYPVLRGRYKGFDVKLEPIVDNMGWRKLPVLFVDVTVIAPTGFPAALDFLMRPNGNEVYSQISRMDYSLKPPGDLPPDALLRTDRKEKVSSADLDMLTPHIRRFSDPTWKEMVVTPRGVRFVRLVDQCSRAHYVAFRELKFAEQVQQGLIQETLDAALALLEKLPASASRLKVA